MKLPVIVANDLLRALTDVVARGSEMLEGQNETLECSVQVIVSQRDAILTLAAQVAALTEAVNKLVAQREDERHELSKVQPQIIITKLGGSA